MITQPKRIVEVTESISLSDDLIDKNNEVLCHRCNDEILAWCGKAEQRMYIGLMGLPYCESCFMNVTHYRIVSLDIQI